VKLKCFDHIRKHKDALYAKKVRLDGLRALYETHEQAGHVPIPGSYMFELRRKIRHVEKSLKVMAEV
jgi:hypothetical protein